jgi:hypothetical protein
MAEYTPVVSATHPARPPLRSGTKCIARADWPGQCGSAQRPEHPLSHRFSGRIIEPEAVCVQLVSLKERPFYVWPSAVIAARESI